ncbi:MAG: CHAT domain-containing tetratricopeptide repeat protein [Candidatus Krumholzibacteriia bacterium]
MIPRHWRLSPLRALVGKASVLVWLAPTTALAAAAPSDLSPAEQAWFAVETGAVAPAAADAAPVRWRWASGDLAPLREREQTDPDAAGSQYVALLQQALRQADPALEQLALERLAGLDIAAQRVGEAQPRLERSLALADSLGQPLASLRAHLDLGRVLIRSREVAAAEEHLARVDTSEFAPPVWRADAALSRSVVARLAMDLDRALALRERAYDLYTEGGSLAGRAKAMHYIGTTYAMRGELTQAMVRLQHAEELARASGSRDVLSGCLGDQAGIRYLIGDFDLASSQYREASDLAEDPRRRAWYLSNLASILAFQGQRAEALPRYEQALEMVRATGDRRTESTILVSLGQNRCVLGDVDRGLADLDLALARAEEYGLPLDAAKALEVKGHELIDLDRLDEAEPLLRDAVHRADQLGYFDLQESARAGLAEIARRRGHLDAARDFLEEAVVVVEQVRRRSGGSAEVQSGYFSQAGGSFDALVGVLYDLNAEDPTAGHGARAWEVAQRGRARSLLDLLAEAEVDLRVRGDAAFREREEAILGAIAALDERRLAAPDSAEGLDAEIRRQEARLTVLEAELRATDPRYAELRYPQPTTLAALREQVLRPGEALLEYQLGERQSHAWFISHDRFEFYRLPPRAEIAALAADVLPLLRDPSLTGPAAAWFTPPARRLAAAILDPVLPALAGTERLIVVPDGVLHYVPLAALPVRDGAVSRFDQVPWLANEVAVLRTPSASALARLRGQPAVAPEASPLLLLADPTLPPAGATSVFVRAAGAAGLAPVPGAAAEEQALVDLYGRQAHWYSGAQATPDRLTAPPGGGAWRSVHLATHGIFNEERPQYSGLVLAPGPGDDGFLDVATIFALDLPCEQVVLSACSSALGQNIDGEGLVGFVSGFLYAGARSVVAALWDVAGDGTARFMRDYYGRLVADGAAASRADALAAARRDLATSAEVTAGGVPLAHPAVWAAFVAVGDAR